ncbi:cytochrome P450 [Mycolicibacterium sediminis]|uniref:Putative cytochrome P450 n=1 Tax=Mycolicibacterium sediminis TaxID=1286180 RepID=A0A7I7QTP3_9MYCO|nr:cytochrome P450 [Mycolicibacterium sediminis]BBY29605.1 putative cytochrome P450 [Mycolicibacterium sediminis]
MAETTTDPVRLPPSPRIPKLLQGIGFVAARERAVARLARRHGSEFVLNLPIFGSTVVISDPALVKEVFTTNTDLIGRAGTLGEVLGPGSTFSLDGRAHRARRKLLVPPFHGKRMQAYEYIIAEEVRRESATWVEGEEFETLPSMMRITLNAILRAVFGADGAALEELRELLPPMVLRASRLAVLPPAFRRDLGPWSPWGRVETLRRRYDAAIARLIADARRDPHLSERGDVLAMLLAARYEDGSSITDDHVADELLTLLAAGHETTATTLAWAVERITRHPRLLARLTEEADAGGSELLQATIFEVQRVRPVIDGFARVTKQRIRLGDYVLPARQVILVSISLAHAAERSFAGAGAFDPDRFVGNPPENHSWIPFGGGVRRCIGAAFANMEMMVTLQTLLREFEFRGTYADAEPVRSRGVASAPGRGGRAVVHRRRVTQDVPRPDAARVTA